MVVVVVVVEGSAGGDHTKIVAIHATVGPTLRCVPCHLTLTLHHQLVGSII